MRANQSRPSLALTLLCVAALLAVAWPGRVHAATPVLNGWFVKTEINFRTSRLTCTYYVFFPDGRMYFGNLPAEMATPDYAKLKVADPKNCGTYTLVGEKLTLQRDGGAAPEEHTYSPGAGGVMDASPLSPVWRLADNTRLEGSWGIDTAVSGRGYSASASTTFVFHRDGVFEGRGHAGVDTRSATGVKSEQTKGVYLFKKTRLFVRYEDGSQKSFDAYGTDSKDRPRILGLDGIEYNNL